MPPNKLHTKSFSVGKEHPGKQLPACLEGGVPQRSHYLLWGQPRIPEADGVQDREMPVLDSELRPIRVGSCRPVGGVASFLGFKSETKTTCPTQNGEALGFPFKPKQKGHPHKRHAQLPSLDLEMKGDVTFWDLN